MTDDSTADDGVLFFFFFPRLVVVIAERVLAEGFFSLGYMRFDPEQLF